MADGRDTAVGNDDIKARQLVELGAGHVSVAREASLGVAVEIDDHAAMSVVPLATVAEHTLDLRGRNAARCTRERAWRVSIAARSGAITFS